MSAPFLSVIVPAYNCAPTLRRCLAALTDSDLPRTQWELIVADDGSTDDTPRIAGLVADRVVRLAGRPSGPAAARNAGAREATGDVLIFIDADVCASTSALSQFSELFRRDAALAAAFGAYDLEPDAPGIVSQYRNLLHHYVHRKGAGVATTFWAGCGAVRRDAFVAAGGFDAKRYCRPQIEDIELGYRLNAVGGRILLCPDIQGRHLKRWTLRSGIVTDFRDRGVPWMELLLERQEVTDAGPLNLEPSEKLFTMLVPLGVVGASIAVVVRNPTLALLSVGLLVVVIVGNAPLLRWFVRVRGWRFALATVPLRIAYYAVNFCSASWATVTYPRRVKGPRGARQGGPSSSRAIP